MMITYQARTSLWIVLLCGMQLGCNESQLRTSGTNPPPPSAILVTTSRPPTPYEWVPIFVPVARGAAYDHEEIASFQLEPQVCMADLHISTEIKREIADSEMIADVQRVQVITRNGVVALQGRVPAEAVKERIEELAARTVDHYPYDIDNQLEVSNR